MSGKNDSADSNEATTEKKEKLRLDYDPRAADHAYQGFPSFKEWAKLSLDTTRWERYSGQIRSHDDLTPELLSRAQEIATRTAAVDTGAIEGLYEVDRGFTFTVATQSALWQAALDEKGPKVRTLIESQLAAYDYVLDFATEAVSVAESWIRELHATVCKGQRTYLAYTELGPQKQKLPLGKYKHLPNHVRKADGSIHSWAPVDLTPAEMHRLIKELRSEAFEKAHPILQASYAHYALVAIHPFVDGNGRVARALASVYTYRAESVPLLILAEHREEYFDALAAADRGERQRFVEFTLERTLDAILLVEQSVRTAQAPEPAHERKALQRLFITSGGYTHAEVDRAGHSLLQLAMNSLNERVKEYNVKGQVRIKASKKTGSYRSTEGKYRAPIEGGGALLSVQFESLAPATATVSRVFMLVVPKDCGVEDDILLFEREKEAGFGARVEEMMPEPSGPLRLRVNMWCEQLIGEGLRQLREKAEERLRKQGYP